MADEIKEIKLKVENETRKGKDGNYTVKIVKNQDKVWTVSKNDKDKVEVGKEYSFNLTKSEYNDKVYYWANLIAKEKDSQNIEQTSTKITNTQVVEYFKNLDFQAKKEMIKYLVEQLNV